MDIPQLVAKQMRIARQDQPTVAAASFDRYAANSFQAYVQSALNFSIQRGALLYGRVDEKDNTVYVDVMYEPPQQGEAERLSMDIECEEVWLSAA
jgi:nuclear protein localization protein 4 homolog